MEFIVFNQQEEKEGWEGFLGCSGMKEELGLVVHDPVGCWLSHSLCGLRGSANSESPNPYRQLWLPTNLGNSWLELELNQTRFFPLGFPALQEFDVSFARTWERSHRLDTCSQKMKFGSVCSTFRICLLVVPCWNVLWNL